MAKSDDDEQKAVNRLLNIETQEVSVVDAAANKRKFLLVKSADGKTTEKVEVTETAKTTTAPAPAAKSTKVAKQVVRWMDSFLDTLASLRNGVEEAPTSDTATVIPRYLALDLREIQLGLKRFAESKHKSSGGDGYFYGACWAGSSSTSLTPLSSECKKAILSAVATAEKQIEKLRGEYEGTKVLTPEEAKTVTGAADAIGAVLATFPAETSKAAIVAKSLTPEDRSKVLAAVAKAGMELLDLEGALRTDGEPVAKIADRSAVEARVVELSTLFKNALGAPSQEAIVPDPTPSTPAASTPAATPAPATSEVAKAGRPMSGDRLTRLKAAHLLFKDAVGNLKAGQIDLQKFDKAAHDISSIIEECDVAKYVAKASARAKAAKMAGAGDARGTTPSAPNVGAGVQPDTSTVADAGAIMGASVPAEVGQVLKAHEQRMKVELEKRDQTIKKLNGKIVELEKFREAPSSYPDDEGSAPSAAPEDSGEVAWGMDMAADLENDRLATLND